MSKNFIVFIVIFIIAAVVGFCYQYFNQETKDEAALLTEQACLDSGGEVKTSLCCQSTADYPNLCLVGPCGCSPDNSHEVKICDCGEDKCFDGNSCR